MNPLIKALNGHVADFGVLYAKLHHYHWFVTGPQFHALHALFEKLYDEVAARLDEVAERILMLGGSPCASLRDFLAHASVQEALGNETPAQMINQTIYDFTTVDEAVRATLRLAQAETDEVTADMLIKISAGLQKQIWMLGALEK